MARCQPFKLGSGDAEQLTNWMGFYGQMSATQIGLRQCTATHRLGENHGQMSAIQIGLRRCRATHRLDENSWSDVSHSDCSQEAQSNSQSG